MRTASSHIYCVLTCLGTSLIQRGTFSEDIFISASSYTSSAPGTYFSKTMQALPMIYQNTFLNKLLILFMPLDPGKDQILWTG